MIDWLWKQARRSYRTSIFPAKTTFNGPFRLLTATPKNSHNGQPHGCFYAWPPDKNRDHAGISTIDYRLKVAEAGKAVMKTFGRIKMLDNWLKVFWLTVLLGGCSLNQAERLGYDTVQSFRQQQCLQALAENCESKQSYDDYQRQRRQ